VVTAAPEGTPLTTGVTASPVAKRTTYAPLSLFPVAGALAVAAGLAAVMRRKTE